MFDAVIADLEAIYRAELEDDDFAPTSKLSERDVLKWSKQLAVSKGTLYDEVAMFLARGFHKRELPFAFCDNIINDLWVLSRFAEEFPPDLFWSVYRAFDEGEDERRVGEDPAEIYTRPRIAEIVELHPAR